MSNTSLLGSYGDSSGAGLMFRNRIINGDMRIDQRNAGTKSTTVTNTYIYGLDRFATFTQTGGSASMQRQSLASSDLPYSQDGLRYFLRHNRESVVGTVNDTHFVAQQIEANNIEDFNFGISTAKQFTISFWAKASSSYNFSLSLANTSFGATRTYVIPFNVTTTWQKYSYTITADTTGTWGTGENIGLSVRFVLGGAGTTSTFNQWKGDNNYVGGSTQFQALTQNSFFDLTGVQVELGTVATPFERRPIGTEFALCRDYCEVLTGGTYSTVGIGFATSTTNAYPILYGRFPRRALTIVESYTGSWYLRNQSVGIAVTSIAKDTGGGPVPGAPALACTTSGGLVSGTFYSLGTQNGSATDKIVLSAEL